MHGLYAFFMHYWIAAFGESELAVRFPSAVAVGITAAALFSILRVIGSWRAAVPAAVAFLLLPRVTAMGIDARSFAFATAAVTATVLVFLLAQRPAASRRWWALFTILLALAVALFLYSALMVLVFAAWVLLDQARRVRLLTLVIAASATALLATSPLTILASTQRGQVAWLRNQQVNPYTIGIESFFANAWWLAGAVLALILVGAMMTRSTLLGSPWLLFLLWTAIPVVSILLATLIAGPLFTPRYLSFVSPAIGALVGLSIATLRRQWRTAVSVTLVVAALPSYLQARSEDGKPGGQPLREVAGFIGEHATPGDAILFGASGTVSLRPRIALAAYPRQFEHLDDIALRDPWPETGSYSDRLKPEQAVAAAELKHERVWVVVGADRVMPGAPVSVLRAEGFHVRVKRFGEMKVLEWVRA
ncbi:glycosyltransferase family 39 protein [Curtobacterium sp. DN_7.5]|uniref:glycosyltransferase family 39 protein n=1 Tax=Curtobacterium sp. DN_7.5 TaxID=3049047 RepID=UPI001F56DB8C|nr:glycosyltransferase family 39 protein [Curtobacterium sp. DN_7.5]